MKMLMLTFAVLLKWMVRPSIEFTLVGIETMDQDDLELINFKADAVGNLEYGDSCRNPWISDVSEDVCFHSNPYLQCVDTFCRCATVRVSKQSPERHEQMIRHDGKCRRLEDWKCNTQEDCAPGLFCMARSSVTEDVHSSSNSFSGYSLDLVEEDDNHRRKTLKEKLRRLYQDYLDNLQKSDAKEFTSTSATTSLNEMQEVDEELDDVDVLGSTSKSINNVMNTSLRVDKICMKSQSTVRNLHTVLDVFCIFLIIAAISPHLK